MDFFFDVFVPHMITAAIAGGIGLAAGYYIACSDEEKRQERKRAREEQR